MSSWHEALTRRLRSLLKTGPFHQLRANEGRHKALLEHDDTTALCMKAMEVLVDAMGLRPGAPREELAEALKPLLLANDQLHEVEISAERHREVVELVIGALLNDSGRRQAYTADYTDFIEGRPVARTLRFRLASEQETLDGNIVLRAEPDGVNLFLRSLDIDLEDAQAATEAVMRSQLERGRLDLALQSAREAQIRSIQYHDKVHAQLRRTRRDIGRVDWRHEVPRLIEEALGHLEGRLSTEREIRGTAQGNLRELLGTPEAETLVRICDLLDDCFDRHLELQRALMQAYEVFRTEQERQRFAPIPVLPLPALEQDLLQPLLPLDLDESLEIAQTFARASIPATTPLLLDLARLWDRLLQPPVERDPLGRALQDAEDLELIPEPPPLFDDATVEVVDGRLRALAEPRLLGDLLDETSDDREARLLVLRALQHYAPEAGGVLALDVERAGERLEGASFEGDDLWLKPAAREGARDG